MLRLVCHRCSCLHAPNLLLMLLTNQPLSWLLLMLMLTKPGTGVLRKFGADCFLCVCVCVCVVFCHLPERHADFCADFCEDFWRADFCTDFRCTDYSMFWCFKIGVPESRKNEHKICKTCGIPMALPVWVPYSLSTFLSRQHVTQSPSDRSPQGEHVSVHRGILGPQGMLAFAFKIKICEESALRTTSLYQC